MISNPTNNSNTDKENKSNKESISIPKTLNDLTLDGLYKAKIDETIINWKNELDCHIDRFNMCGERLKNYELQLQGCFQITDPLAQLIEKVNTDTSTTLKELGLNDDDLEVIANRLTNNGTRLIGQTSIKTLSREDILKMFDSAFKEEEK